MKNLAAVFLLFFSSTAFAQNLLASAEGEATDVDEVRIEGSFVDVYVNSGDRVYFEGRIEGSGKKGDYRFETRIEDRVFIITVEKESNNWKGYRLDDARIDLTVTDGVGIDIDNSSGDIYVANLRASKSRIQASSGDISLKSIVANLDVETSSGDIEVDGLTGDSNFESTSGDQEIYSTRGNIKTRSSSGDITFSGFEGKLTIQATSGDVEIRKGTGAVKVRTSSGNIEGYGITLTDNAYFDATSGNVDMKFTNDLSELSFDLTASSGDLEVGSSSGEDRLIIQKGSIKVVGNTSSGDQEYN